jgi:hypothetical protein
MDAAYCSRKRWPVDGLVQRVNSIYDGLDLWIASDGIEGDPQKPNRRSASSHVEVPL